MTSKSRIVVVAGFHRSLTSAVAQWLHNAGLPMGSYLMPSNPFNPDGYFEDMPLVGLHDQWLARHNTSWQFHDEVPLGMERRLPYVDRYIRRRNRIDGMVWGMKDPRQCLFLTRWSEVLGGAGRYLIVLRHWGACIQSLYRRHSTVLALQEGASPDDSRFWQQPELAAGMWLAYCRRILAFIQSCPKSQRLVITQQSAMNGIPLIELVNKKLGLRLNKNIASPIKAILTHDEVDENIRLIINKEKIDILDALWDSLLKYADVKSGNEQPMWKSSLRNKSETKAVANKLLDGASQRGLSIPTQSITPLGWREQLNYLQSYPRASISLDDISQAIQNQARYDKHAWENLAQAYALKGCPKQANWAWMNVLLSGHTPPYVFMKLGVCHEAMLDEKGAEHFYNQALQRNSSNPNFYCRQAYFWLTLGRYKEAENLLQEAISKGLRNADLLIALAITLDSCGKTQQAISVLESETDRTPQVAKIFLALKLKQDFNLNKNLYDSWVAKIANTPDIHEAHQTLIASITDSTSQQDLAFRIATYIKEF